MDVGNTDDPQGGGPHADGGAESYRRFREDGDVTGLAEIIRDYKDGLILYLVTIVGNVDEAEDLAEDTFVLLGTRKPRDRGGGSFRTWLYTIGRNVALDRLRKTRRHPAESVDDYADLLADMQDLESDYIHGERDAAMHTAMRRLKPEYRQVLWLTYFEGLNNKETARVMRKTVHATQALLSRARKALKEQMERNGFDYKDVD